MRGREALADKQQEMRERWANLRKRLKRTWYPVAKKQDEVRGKRAAYREELYFAAELLELAWIVLYPTQYGEEIRRAVVGRIGELRVVAQQAEEL